MIIYLKTSSCLVYFKFVLKKKAAAIMRFLPRFYLHLQYGGICDDSCPKSEVCRVDFAGNVKDIHYCVGQYSLLESVLCGGESCHIKCQIQLALLYKTGRFIDKT